MPRRKFVKMKKTKKVKLVSSMNSWVGSWLFLFVHVIWFAIWLSQQWKISILTMIVSLEAIILMILLLMAQNHQNIRDDLRDEADLQIDLQAVNLEEKILREIKAIKRDIKNIKK